MQGNYVFFNGTIGKPVMPLAGGCGFEFINQRLVVRSSEKAKAPSRFLLVYFYHPRHLLFSSLISVV